MMAGLVHTVPPHKSVQHLSASSQLWSLLHRMEPQSSPLLLRSDGLGQSLSFAERRTGHGRKLHTKLPGSKDTDRRTGKVRKLDTKLPGRNDIERRT